MHKTLLLAVVAALPVLAQGEAPEPRDFAEQPRHWGAAGEMPNRPNRADFHKKMLEKYDADKDGQLSDAEKEAMKADMEKRRAEGKNCPGVRDDRNPKAPHGERPNREEMRKKMLEKYDADKDGQLSDAEKEAMKADMEKRRAEGKNCPGVRDDRNPKAPHGERPNREEMRKKMLEKYDADKDGQLSDAEKEAMKADRPHRGRGHGKGRGPKGPRGPQRGEAPQGADVPVTLPL